MMEEGRQREIDHAVRLARLIAMLPVHVGVTRRGTAIVAEAFFDHGATLVVGSDEVCNVRIPKEHAVTSRKIVQHVPSIGGMVLDIRDDAHLQANVTIEGEEVFLRGFVRDWPAYLRTAAQAGVPLTGPKVVMRFAEIAVLLHYGEQFRNMQK
jgi:hypothetical protein